MRGKDLPDCIVERSVVLVLIVVVLSNFHMVRNVASKAALDQFRVQGAVCQTMRIVEENNVWGQALYKSLILVMVSGAKVHLIVLCFEVVISTNSLLFRPLGIIRSIWRDDDIR